MAIYITSLSKTSAKSWAARRLGLEPIEGSMIFGKRVMGFLGSVQTCMKQLHVCAHVCMYVCMYV